MTAYMKPQERGIYQEVEQQIQATQTDGRGRLAVPSADPRLKQLDRQQNKDVMDRKLMYGRLGMQKKGMEHDIKMGEGRLGLAKKGMKMSEKKFNFDLKMNSKAANIAKFGMALNLAMGMGSFVQNMKNQRKQDYLYNLTVQLQQQQLKRNREMEEGNA